MDWPEIIHHGSWPPFVVPPDQPDQWDESFEREFISWKRSDSMRLNMNKTDFRQYVLNLNSEFNLDEIFDQLETGLDAFEKLIKFIPRFPNYNLDDFLEEGYSEEYNSHVKDFIRLGVQFVRSLDTAEPSQVDSSTKTLKVQVEDECPVDPGEHADKQPEDNTNQVVEVVDDTTTKEDLSQINSLSSDTIKMHAAVTTPTKVKNKKERSTMKRKESRLKRLLKYQEKLVKTNGLPPSRLMMERENLFGRNLSGEFEQLAGIGSEITQDGGPIPGTGSASTWPAYEPCQDTRPPPCLGNVPPPPPFSYLPPCNVSVSPLLMPGQTGLHLHPPSASQSHGQPLGQWTGTNSTPTQYNLLSPTPESFTGTTIGTVEWSDARPMTGSSWNSTLFKPTGFQEWSTSGSSHIPALSPSTQSSVWNLLVPPYPTQSTPVPKSGSPAYCFHCMQYGAVFQIVPA